jgi:hypothetical protein
MDVAYSVSMDEPFLTNIMKFSWRFMWRRNNYVRLIFTKIKCPTNFMLDLQHQIQYDDSVTKVKQTINFQVYSEKISFLCSCLCEVQRCMRMSSYSYYFKPSSCRCFIFCQVHKKATKDKAH